MTQTTVAETPAFVQDLHNDAFRQAVVQAAAIMDRPEFNGRLQKAMDFVLSGAVTLHEDGTATVKSGSHTYHLESECTCQDSQQRSKWCKHFIAVELLKRTYARLHPMNGQKPVDTGRQVQAQQSAAWQVNEAPASCCLKFQLNGLEIMYTMRDTDDDKLFARVRRILPKLQEKVSTGSGGEQAQASQEPYCPIHGVPMKRYTKGNQSWFSHSLDTGEWCRGK